MLFSKSTVTVDIIIKKVTHLFIYAFIDVYRQYNKCKDSTKSRINSREKTL